MPEPSPSDRRGHRLLRVARDVDVVVERVCAGLLWAGGAIVFLMMLATVYDVVMRYVFAAPTGWVLTLSSAAMPALAFLSAPALLWGRGHIDMDLLHRRLGARPAAVVDMVVGLATLAFAAVLGAFAYQATGSTYFSGLRTSGNFNVPLWPLYGVIWLGCVLMAVAAALALSRHGQTDGERDV